MCLIFMTKNKGSFLHNSFYSINTTVGKPKRLKMILDYFLGSGGFKVIHELSKSQSFFLTVAVKAIAFLDVRTTKKGMLTL